LLCNGIAGLPIVVIVVVVVAVVAGLFLY
jgi:hypothetical protein